MCEHAFDKGEPSDATATELAADLAEKLVDEVSRARHSWRAIYTMARALAELAKRMIDRPEQRPP